MARLSWYTGRFEELSPGQERIGGRADTGYKQPETVSRHERALRFKPVAVAASAVAAHLLHRCLTRRQQFRLECQADGSVTVTSVSALNPTKVQLSAGGFQLLNQGELTFSWCRFSDLLVAG
jgi:hypothetical protein